MRSTEADHGMKHVAARAVHDINNALAAIKNSFLLIKDAIPAAHPNFECVQAIENGTGRIAAVTRQLVEALDRPEGPSERPR